MDKHLKDVPHRIPIEMCTSARNFRMLIHLVLISATMLTPLLAVGELATTTETKKLFAPRRFLLQRTTKSQEDSWCNYNTTTSISKAKLLKCPARRCPARTLTLVLRIISSIHENRSSTTHVFHKISWLHLVYQDFLAKAKCQSLSVVGCRGLPCSSLLFQYSFCSALTRLPQSRGTDGPHVYTTCNRVRIPHVNCVRIPRVSV